MSDLAIRIENIGKRYRYGAVASVNDTLRSDLTEWVRGVFRRNGGQRPAASGQRGGPSSVVAASPAAEGNAESRQPRATATAHESFRDIHERHIAESPDYFWALRDVNLEIKQGEVVGIIGRNGAGKSTLLKILSRITPPTTGKIEYFGRIASLLEVGTGFHRELTGRENIFLNGSILGMPRREIVRKFDEIVAFAEVERFIDTPVKFYSSGMYVRLAFAVAAHLESEIVVIDEVLAVGDSAFQNKCIGKIGEVARGGRTVLFVSHNMTVVSSLCNRAVLIEAGRKISDGRTQDVTGQYISANTASPGAVQWNPTDNRINNGRVRLAQARVIQNDQVTSNVEIDETFAVEIEFEVLAAGLNVCSSIHVFDRQGICAFVSGNPARSLDRGFHAHRYCFPGHLMNDGTYTITIILLTETTRQEINLQNALSFTVHESRGRTEYLGTVIGTVRPRLQIVETALSPGKSIA